MRLMSGLAAVMVAGVGTMAAQVPMVVNLNGATDLPPFALAGLVGDLIGGPGACTHQPYSYLETMTSAKTLADGTHISRAHKVRITKDSECRVRSEQMRERDGVDTVDVVSIMDPVSRTSILLMTKDKTARVTHWPEAKKPTPEEEARAEKMRAEVAKRQAEQAAAGPSKVKLANGSSMEHLGQRNIDGVLVDGTKSTHVSPAGTNGNDRELVKSYERWHSPELGVDMLRIDTNPEVGVITTTVSDLQRGAPDVALFRVPEGYVVKESPLSGSK